LYGLPISNSITTIYPESNRASLENGTPISNNKKPIFNPLISEEYKKEIELKINKWITKQKFLENDASILTLATFVEIPIHHISYYFNTFLKIRYTDWCNTLRIDFAKAQIDSGLNKNITLLAFSELCGFSSQSTFLRSFKNVVGSTPSDYIKTKKS
jgi:AraC-like DNA-binding protein